MRGLGEGQKEEKRREKVGFTRLYREGSIHGITAVIPSSFLFFPSFFSFHFLRVGRSPIQNTARPLANAQRKRARLKHSRLRPMPEEA